MKKRIELEDATNRLDEEINAIAETVAQHPQHAAWLLNDVCGIEAEVDGQNLRATISLDTARQIVEHYLREDLNLNAYCPDGLAALWSRLCPTAAEPIDEKEFSGLLVMEEE